MWACGSSSVLDLLRTELVRRVEAGEEIVIRRGRTPVARLVAERPVAFADPGALRRRIWIAEDFDTPLRSSTPATAILRDDAAARHAHVVLWRLAEDPRLTPSMRRLRECDDGVLNGASFDQVHDEAERRRRLRAPYPGGESWQQAVERASAVPEELDRWAGHRVLVIGHTATRWALEHHLNGHPLGEGALQWQPGWEYTLDFGNCRRAFIRQAVGGSRARRALPVSPLRRTKVQLVG